MVVLNFSISISKLMGLEFTWTKTKIHGLGNLLEGPVLPVQTCGIGLESQSFTAGFVVCNPRLYCPLGCH